MCAYQGIRNVRFSGNFEYLLNRWPLPWKTVSVFKQNSETKQTKIKLILLKVMFFAAGDYNGNDLEIKSLL